MKRVAVDNNMFNCVKILLGSKTPYDEIEKYTGISKSTIQRIKVADSFEDYKRNVQAISAAYSAKAKKALEEEATAKLNSEIEKQKELEKQEERTKDNKPHSNMLISNYQINRMIELQKEQNEILKIMSNKIAFIVDELTRPAKKTTEQ